ncbi:MAG: metallophosphoesterase N-terminal domain-containing protein, partial [Luteimonas sp.]
MGTRRIMDTHPSGVVRSMRSKQFMLALGLLLLAPASWAESWNAAPEVVRGVDGPTIGGVVFEDTNGDGKRQPGEAGVAGVLVSNGLDVVRTDSKGEYAVAVRPDMDVFVIQPSGWKVPVDTR